MANYYTKFSVAFSLPSKEAEQYAINLHAMLRKRSMEDVTEVVDIPEVFMDEDFTCNFECERDGSDSPGLWLHQDDGESCGVESAITFIQHLLQKFIPEDQQDKWVIQLEWSNDCSGPRLDGFGGGAAIITAKSVDSMSTCEWLQGKLPQHRPLESGQRR